MIHWTRQIKEVLSSQDALQTAENAGPLEEIDFWKNRCADLSGISDQLDKRGQLSRQTPKCPVHSSDLRHTRCVERLLPKSLVWNCGLASLLNCGFRSSAKPQLSSSEDFGVLSSSRSTERALDLGRLRSGKSINAHFSSLCKNCQGSNLTPFPRLCFRALNLDPPELRIQASNSVCSQRSIQCK